MKASFHSRKPKVNFQEQSSDEDVLRETIERFNSLQPEATELQLGSKSALKVRRTNFARNRSSSKLLKETRKFQAEEMMRQTELNTKKLSALIDGTGVNVVKND